MRPTIEPLPRGDGIVTPPGVGAYVVAVRDGRIVALAEAPGVDAALARDTHRVPFARDPGPTATRTHQ